MTSNTPEPRDTGTLPAVRHEPEPLHPLDLLSALAGLSPDVPVSQVLEVRNRVDEFMARAKEFKAAMDLLMIDFIEKNGDITVGDIRFYVGEPPKTTCRNVRATLEALLNAAGGDLDAVCACLSSSAIKHGAAKQVLSIEVWDQCFEVVREKTIEEGRPKKLQRVDTKFLK